MPYKQTSKQIRILGVFAYFYPHRGGSQKYAEELYARLVKDYSNVSVDVLAYNTDKVITKEQYRGFAIYRIPCFNLIYSRFSLPNPFSLAKILWNLKANKYTHVNTHIRFFDPTWWLWFYAKLIGAKSIFTGHVAVHPVYEKKVVHVLAYIVDKTVAQVSLKFYDYITYTNKCAQKFFKNSLGVKKSTTVVYGGVDTAYFSPKKIDKVVPNLGIPINKNAVVVSFVGRVTWTKGVTYLYSAIQNFYDSYKGNQPVIFIIAGPGDLKKNLLIKAKKEGLTDKIIFTGNLNYKQVRDLYRISDIFINPSHHNEGFPNTILEAGSTGCFVIATDNAGTKEVVQNGVTGLLVPQKDPTSYTKALIWAVKNKKKRIEISNEMRKQLIKKHDWGVIAKKFYRILIKDV
jgi:glycosyltransferase involved in cell wall biosynthesis